MLKPHNIAETDLSIRALYQEGTNVPPRFRVYAKLNHFSYANVMMTFPADQWNNNNAACLDRIITRVQTRLNKITKCITQYVTTA